MRVRKTLCAALMGILLAPAVATAAEPGSRDLPAFPGAQGWGATALGGRHPSRTPVVLTVDTTADDERDGCDRGHCTLREALRETRPRFIVFNTTRSVFRLERHDGAFAIDLGPRQSFVTVLGQTAPAGVEVANGQIVMRTGFSHGVFQHLKFRPGIWDGPGHRRTERGCNAWAWRADRDPEACGLPAGVDDRAACEALSCNKARTCSRREKAEYVADTLCRPCNHWEAARPDDWSHCSDAQLERAPVGDGFSLHGAHDVLLDHVSVSWFHDEGFTLNGSPQGPRRVTVQNSIVGAGHVASAVHPGRRERPHNLNVLVVARGGHPERISVHHNVFLHTFNRNPRLAGGRLLEWRNNVHYNSERVVQIEGKTTLYDFADNLFRLGPDGAAHRRKQGYCRPEGVVPCGRVPKPCRGRCSEDVWPFARVGGGPRVRMVGSLYFAGNAFQAWSDGAWRDLPGIAARGYTPAFDEQWDRLVVGGARPRWWAARRQTPAEQPPFPVAIEPASGLWTSLSPHVGSSRPARDSIDRALLESVDRYGDVPERALPYTTTEPHYAYAAARGPARADGDKDGLPDDYEKAHGHLDPGKADALGDADGDGYLEIEEWACGLDPTADSSEDTCTGPDLPAFTESEPSGAGAPR